MDPRHDPLHCFIPPHVLDRLSESDDPEVRRIAVQTIEVASEARAVRATLATMPMMAAIPSPAGTKHRLVYDMETRRLPLPGKPARQEDQDSVTDDAVNEAYDYSGYTYDFYQEIFQRNSLDNNGMSLISSAHLGRNINNAFWNGEQMLYGDGDGIIFSTFTKALDVVAHELTHGVITFECNLIYQDEPGALNEHFADVMSALVKQWRNNQTVTQADWLLGPDIMMPASGIKSLRTMKGEKAYENHPTFGTDPQPKHMRDKYTGTADNGGVHINSGIPNYAFYLVSTALGGYAWQQAGKIWYQTLKNLNRTSGFQEAASMTYQVAGSEYGIGSAAQNAVQVAWQEVGILVQ
jgi:Zn-dependent metalloprotease